MLFDPLDPCQDSPGPLAPRQMVPRRLVAGAPADAGPDGVATGADVEPGGDVATDDGAVDPWPASLLRGLPPTGSEERVMVVHAVVAQPQAVEAAAVAALVAAVAPGGPAPVVQADGSLAVPARAPADVRVVDALAPALCLGRTSTARRVVDADQLVRALPRTWRLLADGLVDAGIAAVVVRETGACTEAVAARVDAALGDAQPGRGGAREPAGGAPPARDGLAELRLTDPFTGTVVGVDGHAYPPGTVPPLGEDEACPSAVTTGYRIPVGLRRLVALAAPTCVAPGCSVPAARCDLDHRAPWPSGPTCSCNLAPLCRTHHRMKTHRGWRLTPGHADDPATCSADATVTWTSPTGATYEVSPARRWPAAVTDPVTAADVLVCRAARRAREGLDPVTTPVGAPATVSLLADAAAIRRAGRTNAPSWVTDPASPPPF